jgi:hypothetical protein
MPEIDWKREFEAIGAKGVRGALIANRWDDQKRSAAREWLERGDAAQWQATRAGVAVAGEAKSSLDAFRRYRWVYYIAGGAFGLLGLAQMIKF